MNKQSLRHRITFSFVLFAALLSAAITTGVHLTVEDIEKSLIEDSLRTELEYVMLQGELPPGASRRLSANITLYHTDEAQHDIVPAMFRELPPGNHELKQGKEMYNVFIAPSALGMVYVVEDATEFEKREDALHIALTAMMAISVLLALWLSLWLSGKVISPLTALAQQVAKLRPGQARPSSLAAQYANDEVGQLAATFDTYLQQMEKFIRREQEFTADASHELRTPLAVINGACELLLENPELSQRVLCQIERINRAGTRMSQMLESLLLLARETPPGLNITEEPFAVEEVVMEVVDQHRPMTRHKPVALRYEVVTGFELNTSRTALVIVLSNLLRNAINYTEKGSVVMRVSERHIEIRDTGSGINAVELTHIFERYFRGRNVHQNGSGIGLSIVKRICDRQHWQISISSEPGTGTTVSLDF